MDVRGLHDARSRVGTHQERVDHRLKNIGLYSIACLTFYLVGYNIMFTGVEAGDWFGSLDLLHGPTIDERALLAGDPSAAAAVMNTGHAAMSEWLFQMVFVASAASIVSGTLAERVKLWSFFLFILVLTAVIYPVVGAWTWGGGWLALAHLMWGREATLEWMRRAEDMSGELREGTGSYETRTAAPAAAVARPAARP